MISCATDTSTSRIGREASGTADAVISIVSPGYLTTHAHSVLRGRDLSDERYGNVAAGRS